MSVQTVLGKIESDQLGIVLTHEHVVIDRSKVTPEPVSEMGTKYLFHQKITMDKLGILKKNPLAMLDNLIIMDEKEQYEELMHFKYAGGKTIVDVTNIGLGRDPELLRRMAVKTGLNIVTGAGFYVESFVPDAFYDRSVEDLERDIMDEIRVGIGHTDIKAGVIGEVGVSMKMLPFEKKSLTASCRAQAETGAPLSIHVNPWAPQAYEVMEIVKAHQLNPEKVTICHMDLVTDEDYLVGLLDKGIFLEFDGFARGIERAIQHCKPGVGRFLTDWETLRMIKKLIDRGYINQLVLSMDVCMKIMLWSYGGWGYDHIISNLVPMMKEIEITQTQIDEMLINNPARWLDVK